MFTYLLFIICASCTSQSSDTVPSTEEDYAIFQELKRLRQKEACDNGTAYLSERLPSLAKLVETDQSDRADDLPATIAQRDLERRAYAAAWLSSGCVLSPDDLFRVAVIFQHGTSSEHYLLSAVLSARAAGRGAIGAREFTAKAVDRYLQSHGSAQIFGTQAATPSDYRFYSGPDDAKLCKWPVTSDSEFKEIMNDYTFVRSTHAALKNKSDRKVDLKTCDYPARSPRPFLDKIEAAHKMFGTSF